MQNYQNKNMLHFVKMGFKINLFKGYEAKRALWKIKKEMD